MAPITFSKNQFDVLDGDDAAKSRSTAAPPGEDGLVPPSTLEELTKDLMMMDDDADFDGQGDESMPTTQDLDWNFGEDGLDFDGILDANDDEGNDKDDEDDDLHMDDDDDDDDSDNNSSSPPSHNDSSENYDIVERPSPLSGRKKANVPPIEETKPSDDVEAESAAEEKSAFNDEKEEKGNGGGPGVEDKQEDGEDGSEEEDDDDSDDDDNTVAMSEEEDDSNANGTQGPLQPTEDTIPIPTEADPVVDPTEDDSDAWLDGSDEEGKKWREKAHSNDSNSEDEDEQQELDISDEKTKADDMEDDEGSTSNQDEVAEAAQGVATDTPRRSVRARRARTIYSEDEDAPAVSKPKTKRVPAMKVWMAALDQMYAETEDKTTATTKPFRDALSEKFGCKMNKNWKKQINERLYDLFNNKAKPADEEKNVSDSEEEDADDEASVATDPGQDASDFEDEARTSRAKRRGKRTKAKRGNSSKEKPPGKAKMSKRKAERAAKMIEMQKLRRKQLLEEKVRNEEMQLNRSKEEQERDDAINAKLETNTDELRLKRLEDRLDLLQQLDQKRISVIVVKHEVTVKNEVVVKEEKVGPPAATHPAKDASESEESSSEEEDLVIVGIKKPLKPLKPLHNHLPSSALDLLNGIRSPEAKKFRARQSKPFALPNGTQNNGVITSPGKSMGARFALRNALKQKQRRMGNLWLARELGYTREEDHVKDCMSVAEQKRELVIKLEQERQKANERKILRERLLLQEAGVYEEQQEEGDAEKEESPAVEGEEEDEELQMAKEIEQETEHDEEDHGDGPVEDVEESNSETKEAGATIESDDAEIQRNEEANALETQPTEVSKGISETETLTDSPDRNTDDDTVEDELPSTEMGMVESNAQDTQKVIAGELQTPAGDSQDVESQFLETQPPTSISNDGDLDASARSGDSGTLTVDSVVTPERDAENTLDAPINQGFANQDEEEAEFKADDIADGEEKASRGTKPKNSLWQEALRREAEKLKKLKKRKGGLVEEEAEEEEEEEVAGLEDFGFTVSKKKNDDDEEDNVDDEVDEDDLKHIVDEVSDGEGDEEAGMAARRRLEAQEEKRRHKEYMRRAREGHDGRRGGIAGGSGARGLHAFDQLVAPDNREDAKRLGLLNDDELESEDEKEKDGQDDEEEDETALLDQDIRKRHLHQSDVNVDDDYLSSEEEDELEIGDDANESDIEEEKAQRRLNKLFKKRATMKDYELQYGKDEEFSQQRLIDEDTSMKEELKRMRNGLARKRSISSSISQSSQSSNANGQISMFGPPQKKQRVNFGSIANRAGGTLSVALLASRTTVRRTSFLGGARASSCTVTEHSNSVASGHFLFNSQSSKSGLDSSSNPGGTSAMGGTKRKIGMTHASTLFSRVVGRG